MRMKFLAYYDPRAMGNGFQRGDRRVDARALVEGNGGRLQSVIVTYADVDSVQFIAVFPGGDTAFEIAVMIQAAGGLLAKTNILKSSRTRATAARGTGNVRTTDQYGPTKFEPRAAKAAGSEPSSYPLNSGWD